MTEPSPFQRLRARVLLPAMMVTSLVAMLVVEIVSGEDGQATAPLGAMLGVYAAMVVVLLAGARIARMSWRRLFGGAGSAAEWPLIAVAIPLAVMSYGGFWLLWVPVSYLAPGVVESYALEGMPDLLTRDNPRQLALDILVIVVIAPVVEEVLFRGVLLHRWAHRWGTAAGVALSSLVFAVLHVELIGHFIFAVAMAALYVRSGSLWLPIGAHALNNAFAVALSIPALLRGAEPETPTLQEFRAEWHTGALALAFAIAVLILVWRRFQPARPWVLPYALPAGVMAAGETPGVSGSGPVGEAEAPGLAGTPIA